MSEPHVHPAGSPFPIRLTPVAAAKLREALEKEGGGPGSGVRVGVTPGGCSGLSYTMSFDEAARPGDLVSEQEGLRLYVAGESAVHLEGVTIDYVESLTNAGFRFVNPNATRTCGCGTSFS